MMQRPGFLFISLIMAVQSLAAQDVDRLIASIRQTQANLRAVEYRLERTDTLVTGTVRHLSGRAMIRVDRNNRLFGFWFRARQDDVAGEVVYDGRVGYMTDDSAKMYTLLTDSSQIQGLTHQAGGRVLLPDLIHLDTTRAVRFSLLQDEQFFFLTIHYADLTAYDVTHRFKTVGIDKASLLPMSVRQHQETLGKVQDLFYRVERISQPDTLLASTFNDPAFLSWYQQKIPPMNRKKPINDLWEKAAPTLQLRSLLQDSLLKPAFLGKVTLLDFWEVWCGPCLAAMPAVEKLHETYASRGLQVYGITHETNQLPVARRVVRQRGLRFPTLIGDEPLRRAYRLSAIPLYVVIDQTGKIAFVQEGFSKAIEQAIQKLIR